MLAFQKHEQLFNETFLESSVRWKRLYRSYEISPEAKPLATRHELLHDKREKARLFSNLNLAFLLV